MGARLLAPTRGAIGGEGMSYDGTENDRSRFMADQIARLDATQALMYDERITRLLQDPIYVTNWRNTVRAYVQSNQQGSGALIASLAMLTLASLEAYERDDAAVDILAAAFDDGDDEDLFKRIYTE